VALVKAHCACKPHFLLPISPYISDHECAVERQREPDDIETVRDAVLEARTHVEQAITMQQRGKLLGAARQMAIRTDSTEKLWRMASYHYSALPRSEVAH
jgi:hypothetical protein